MELVLIRDLPGSGKSTLARSMHSHEHIEADMYFVDDLGQYEFNPTQLNNAHKWCQLACRTHLKGGRDVVVSNTFTQLWEMQPYFDLAVEHGATVRVIEATGNFENIHDVPENSIQRMRERWEEYNQ